MLLEAHHMIRNPLKKCDIVKYKEHFMTLVARLIQICRPFTKSGCKSIKFHQPYHWYLTRIEIGCAAMEKSLERMLGETQKKPFKYTNSRFDVEDQLERRNTQALQLRDLLHLVGEKPLVPGVEKRLARVLGCSPQLMNASAGLRTLDMIMRTGLPTSIPQVAVDAIFRSIQRQSAGMNPILPWTHPITVGVQIKLTLEDRQLHLDDPRRRSIVVLRALPIFQGVPAYDIIKVILQDDTAEASMYFGKCVAFLRDYNMRHYVLLHWFTRQEPVTGFNVYYNVPSFKLARMDQTLSYSVVPVDCILNGAVLLPEPHPQIGTIPQPDACYWALLSPREHESYKLSFL
jgi:hypothetical protein